MPYRGDKPPLTDQQFAELKPWTPDWKLIEEKGIKHIERTFKTKDLAEAVALQRRSPIIILESPSNGERSTSHGGLTR